MTPLASGKAPGVVAVSGGADGVALLTRLADSFTQWATLTVAHINHQLARDRSRMGMRRLFGNWPLSFAFLFG